MKRLFTMILVAFVLVGFAVVVAEASVKKIRPDQLKIENSTDSYLQTPARVSGDLGDCHFTAVVKLPVGKRISKLKYYHFGSGSDPFTAVTLYRIKMGEDAQQVSDTTSGDDTVNLIAVETTGIDHPRIKTGYTYYVRVYSQDSHSGIYGIKIFYED